MNSLSHASGVRSGLLLSNPAARGQIAAAGALAGWHGHGANGWWRHGGGGYGWVGPLFWPFAYYDIYDYTIWGDFGFEILRDRCVKICKIVRVEQDGLGIHFRLSNAKGMMKPEIFAQPLLLCL